jgi:hypothetical protein
MTRSFGFRVTSCPLYPRPAQDAEVWLDENFLTQRALWNALRSLFRKDFSASIELRFRSGGANTSIHSDLLIHCHDPIADDLLVSVSEAIARLLPGEYGWSHLAGAPKDDESKWFLHRLVRRLDFFDLPTTSSLWGFGADAAKVPPAAAAGSPPLGQSAEPSTPSAARPNQGNPFAVFALSNSSQRELPDLHIPNPLNELRDGTPLCIPILAEIENESPDVKRLLLDLLHSAPAIVSITLHFGPKLMPTDDERVVATRLKLLLEPFAFSVAGAGYASAQGLRRIYDRYWLPSHRLCNLSIRVAAGNKQLARGLAYNLAGQFGGSKAFEILPAEEGVDLDALWRPEEEIVADRAGDRWQKALDGKLKAADVSDKGEPIYRTVLSRLPALFTMDEASELLRLPCATEGGLPGIATRVIPPFYSSSPDPVPFNEAPVGKIRIGVIKSSSIAPQSTLPAGSISTDEPRWGSSFWHTMEIKHLCKHALIVGSTGSGKTQTTLFLMTELARNSIPFLVIEPVKTEYLNDLRPWVPDVARFRLELTRDDIRITSDGKRESSYSQYLRFDPLRLMPGVTPARHISYLKSCFEAAFPLESIASMVLESGIRSYYLSQVEAGGCGFEQFQFECSTFVRDGTPARVVPSFADFRTFFLGQYLDIAFPSLGSASEEAQERKFEIRQMFTRRFDSITEGPLGTAFAQADQDFFRVWRRFVQLLPEEKKKGATAVATLRRMLDQDPRTQPFFFLLKQPTVVELDGISDNEQKALVMAFLLTFLYEYRQATKTTASANSPHVLVIEEAHRLLARDAAGASGGGDSAGLSSRGKAVGLFVDMLAEIRALGQSLFIVEQIPTKLVVEAVKNTNLKIMLRLTSSDDRDYLGEAMNFNDDQKRFVSTLRPLQLAVFEENLDQPVLLTIPHNSRWGKKDPQKEYRPGSEPLGIVQKLE